MSQVNCLHVSKGRIGTDRIIICAYTDGMKPCSHPLSDLIIVPPDEYFIYQPYEQMLSSNILEGSKYKGDLNKQMGGIFLKN